MGWITDNFGTLAAYESWKDNRPYDYHVKLSYLSTSEILKTNPAGTTEMGKDFDRHPDYKGIFNKVSLGLRFAVKTGFGGDILHKSLYKITGIKSVCTVEIVKKNPATDDFDNKFTGLIDFNPTSYHYDVDSETGEPWVTADIIQTGLVQKFLGRHKMNLDITKNVSVGGVVITDTGSEDITFTPIDIYIDSLGSGGTISYSNVFTTSGTEYAYYAIGSEVYNRIGSDIDFSPISNGQIYTNSSGGTLEVRTEINTPYSIEWNCGTGSSLTIEYILEAYNSVGGTINQSILKTVVNNQGGLKIDTGIISGTVDYSSQPIPNGGYIRFYARITAVKGAGNCSVDTMSFTGVAGTLLFITKSDSIGSTDVVMYKIRLAMKKAMRLICDKDDCFDDTYLQTGIVATEYISSVRNLRGYPDSWIITSFYDMFNHVNQLWNVALDYDSVNDRFKIISANDVFPTSTILNLGVCKNVKVEPSEDYASTILSGYDQDGKVEEFQGAQITHLRSEHSMDFTIDKKLDLRAPFIASGFLIEILRRKQYNSDGQTDTNQDKDIIYVAAFGGSTNTDSSMSGIYGIRQNYNAHATPRKNLLRNKYLKGLFNYDSGGIIRFVNNEKNVQYSYNPGPTNETDDINISDLPSPYYIAEKIEFETELTKDTSDQLNSNPYGVVELEDEYGATYKMHIFTVKSQDDKKIITITGRVYV